MKDAKKKKEAGKRAREKKKKTVAYKEGTNSSRTVGQHYDRQIDRRKKPEADGLILSTIGLKKSVWGGSRRVRDWGGERLGCKLRTETARLGIIKEPLERGTSIGEN